MEGDADARVAALLCGEMPELVARRDGPTAFGGSERPAANGLLHFQDANVVIVEEVIEALTMQPIGAGAHVTAIGTDGAFGRGIGLVNVTGANRAKTDAGPDLTAVGTVGSAGNPKWNCS